MLKEKKRVIDLPLNFETAIFENVFFGLLKFSFKKFA